jgi:hypothetical protein
VSEGTNVMAWDPMTLPDLVRGAHRVTQPHIPEGWDGHAAQRIVDALVSGHAAHPRCGVRSLM